MSVLTRPFLPFYITHQCFITLARLLSVLPHIYLGHTLPAILSFVPATTACLHVLLISWIYTTIFHDDDVIAKFAQGDGYGK